MCINLEASISAFVISIGCSIYLWNRNLQNDRYISLAFGYAGTMQLLEAFLWLDQQCGELNKFVTELARWQVALQPLVIMMITLELLKPSNPLPLIVVFAVYAYLSLPWIVMTPGGCSKSCSLENSGLEWPWTESNNHLTWVIFLIAEIFPMLYLPKNGITYSFLTALLFVVACIISNTRSRTSVTSGSLWCLLGALMPVAAIFINKSSHTWQSPLAAKKIISTPTDGGSNRPADPRAA